MVAIRGATAARTSSNSINVYAGSGSKLWQFEGSSTAWLNVSRTSGGNYALGTDDIWQFIQFNPAGTTANYVIALDGADALQYIDVNSGTNFAAVSALATSGSPPSYARYAAVSGTLVLFANTSNSTREVSWPGRNGITWWTPGQQDCDAQTFPDGGDIMGITGIETGGLVIQTETIRQYWQTGDRAILGFRRAEAASGTRSPYSIIPYQGGIFYYSNRGFAAVGLDGTSRPIGYGYVDEWFLANSNVKTRPKAVIGALDPLKSRMFWLFAMNGNATSNTYDSILCFDPATVGTEYGPWTHANIPATYIFAAATTSTSLDALDALGYNLDTVPYSLDSDVWAGGAPALGMFDATNVLNFFSGANLQATVDTALFAPIPNKRTFVRGFRPLCDALTVAGQSSNQVTGRVGTAERAEDFIVWAGYQNLTPQGLIPCRASGRFLRAEVVIPAGATWNNLAGIDDVDMISDGER